MQAVILEPVGAMPVAAIRMLGDRTHHAVPGCRIRLQPEMTVTRVIGPQRITDQIAILHVADRFGKRLLAGGADHARRPLLPADAFLAAYLLPVDLPRERLPQHLRQLRDR